MRYLKENELPNKEAKIYPEFNIKDHIIAKEITGGMNRYVCRVQSFVKINRNNINYLTSVVMQHEEHIIHKDKNKIDLSEFLKQFKAECDQVMNKYVIPENTILDNGNELIIYKYE